MNHISTSAADRRQGYRLAIHHQSRLTFALDGPEPEDDAIHGVTLIDISHDGLMATDDGYLVPGARVLLEVPLVGWREAEVRWIADNRAGWSCASPRRAARGSPASAPRWPRRSPACRRSSVPPPQPHRAPAPPTTPRAGRSASCCWRWRCSASSPRTGCSINWAERLDEWRLQPDRPANVQHYWRKVPDAPAPKSGLTASSPIPITG